MVQPFEAGLTKQNVGAWPNRKYDLDKEEYQSKIHE